MNFSKIQKIISIIVLFFFFFNSTIAIPSLKFFSKANASNTSFYNLVSILVSSDIYNQINSKVDRYARDIQGVLQNTRVVILPVPKNAIPFEIASLNEGLYFEGYKSLDKNASFNSKLIGSIFIGQIPLPIIFDNGKSIVSIAPYVDFEDKAYIYDYKQKAYVKNKENKNSFKAEIWHSFISPNTGNKSEDIKKISDFLDKDHDFYVGKNLFDKNKGVLNGKTGEDLPVSYKPFVFYYDQFREQASIHYPSYKGYKAYLDNKEDLNYNRFSKKLAEKIEKEVLDSQNEELDKILEQINNPKIKKLFYNSGKLPDTSKSSDIMTRFIINKTTKNFLEVFNKGTISDFRTNVHNAGRYNEKGAIVNADFIPYLVTILDSISQKVVRASNNDLENKIDDLVKSKLAKKIKIPTLIEQTYTGTTTDLPIYNFNCTVKYRNFYSGLDASKLKTARDCSIYRGSTYNSGTLVEANRGLDIKLMEHDAKLCKGKNPTGYYAGSSPVNLDISRLSNNIDLKLKSYDLNKAVSPIFDIKGSKKISDSSKNPSPKDCLKYNFIQTYKQCIDEKEGDIVYDYEVLKNNVYNNKWTCDGDNIVLGKGSNYKNYVEIPSYIMHKSPTKDELYTEITNPITPNLPIDRDRYVDFFAGENATKYTKIIYPNLYRIKGKNLVEVKNNLDKLLDKKSEEINKIGEAKIDLKKYLQSIPVKKINLNGEQKEISYYDLLVFSIFWNNLNNVSSKYKFIFENYLSDQIGNNKKYLLSKNKKEYEIAYLGAMGDAKNMYIKLDPEEKNKQNPYSSIIGMNNKLNTYIYSNSLNLNFVDNRVKDDFLNSNKNPLKCAPPEGVSLFKWIPAVICRLKNMLPPKIKITDGDCGASLFGYDDYLKDKYDIDNKEEFNKQYNNAKNNPSCQNDDNKNGINDCLDKNLDGSTLDFSSDANRYFYDKVGTLKTVVKNKFGKRIYLDNNTQIYYYIDKIIDKENNKIIFDDKKDKYIPEKYKDYIGFNRFYVPSKYGFSKYYFTTGRKDADIIFKAASFITDRNTGKRKILAVSSPLKIEIRGDRMFISSSNKINGNFNIGGDYVIANDKTNIYLFNGKNNYFENIKNLVNSGSIVFSLTNYNKKGQKISLNYPINVKILDNKNNSIFETNFNSLNSLKSLFAIKNSGKYLLKIKDSRGFLVTKKFEVKPSFPKKAKITLGTNILGKDGVSTNFVTIYDRFNNPVIGDFYDIDLEILGDSVSFLGTDSKELSLTTLEGFKAFRLKAKKAGVSKIIATIKKDNKKILNTNSTLKVLDNIQIRTSVSRPLKVGGQQSIINLEVLDSAGNLINNFNSRVYLQVDTDYGTTSKNYYEIKNGKALIDFRTYKTAGEDINFNFQIEGINKIFTKKFSILPLSALKIEILPTKKKLEANPSSYTTLNIELKDAYNNIVWTDNSTKLNLEILPKYSSIVTALVKQKKVSKGKASFKVYATDNPGIAYIKISSNPSLSNNYFEIKGQAPFKKDKLHIISLRKNGTLTDLGKKIFYEVDDNHYRFRFNTLEELKDSKIFKILSSQTKAKLVQLFNENNYFKINGVGENVVSLETFYFWKASKIAGNRYNGLYSVLLGADYGNITKKDYLASGILFDKNNRGLAITSLVSSPYEYKDIFNINNLGKINKVSSSSDLIQNIDYNLVNKDNKSFIKLFNKNLGIDIGGIYFNFSKNDTNLKICENGNCNLDNKTSIYGIENNSDYKYKISGDTLVLQNIYGDNIFSITNSGKIVLNKAVKIKLSNNLENNYLVFDVVLGDKKLASLGFRFINSKIKVVKNKGLLDGLLRTTKNNIILYIKSENYGVREIYSLDNLQNLGVYYKDPFAKKYSLNSFAKGNFDNFENFKERGGLGWKGLNKTLLEFAAGKNVGDSVKDYQSLLTINLGDPVVYLKKKKIKFSTIDKYKNFDRTIGKKINKDENKGYKVFDFNNDGKKDILLIGNDGYFSLLENKKVGGHFKNLGHLAYVADIGNLDLVGAGDFTGDKYSDIFFVDNKGRPALLNNDFKDFKRIDLSKQFNLSGKITIARVFDMDADGKDDIVTLDDNGEINIFYGGGTHDNPKFTKKLVDKGYSIKLKNTPRSDYSFVYFDGVPQINKNNSNLKALESSEELNKAINDSIKTHNSSKIANTNNRIISDNVNTELINNLIYLNFPYSTGSINNIGDIIKNQKDKNLINDIKETKNDLNNFVNDYSKYISNIGENNNTKQTTFIRGQYARALNLEVTKIYKDRNGGNLKSGDIVNVTVTLKNIGNKTLKNIAYIEDVPRLFSLIKGSITNSKNLKVKPSPGEGEFLIDGFSLKPREELKINYNLRTNNFKFGYIKVGLFEKGELGDDKYGDIIYKENYQNCSKKVSIYRSIAAREYQKGEKAPSCGNTNNIKKDEDTENIDKNNNGIPDYIDKLLNDSKSGNISAIKNFAHKKLQEQYKDSDDDGVPDFEDKYPDYSDDDNLSSSLDKINEEVDKISAGIDKIIEGFGCGFGGGSCLANPLNWAPLAPGNDPTLFGMPIGDGLKVSEGYPIFSSLTGLQTTCGYSSCCIPVTWPTSPLAYVPGPRCGSSSAGGNLGTWSPTNNFRLYWTPTLTLGQGIAACFGGPASVVGYSNPPGTHPIVPGGNCVVVAAPLMKCNKEDEDLGYVGQNGIVTFVGGGVGGSDEYGIINANCNNNSNNLANTNKIGFKFIDNYIRAQKIGFKNSNVAEDLIDALKKPNNSGTIPNPGNDLFSGEPFISMNGGNNGLGDLDVSLDISGLSTGNYKDVVKVKNTRIAAFPDFLMDWVTRQIEEIVTKLTDFPDLYIILPDFDGAFDLEWDNFFDDLKRSYVKNKGKGLSGVNSGISGVYEFLGNIPFINIEPEQVNVNIPWIDSETLNKTIIERKATLIQYKEELNKYKKVAKNPESIVKLNSFISSLEQNIAILEEYKKFPEKLASLVNKKQERLDQILCNIESISDLIGGWLGRNGKRFKAWVETYLLVKAILKSWQILADLFIDFDAECHTCKNERNDLLYFELKLVSFIIPKIPVIQFSKWPDIILDLHNVRLSIDISIPEFKLNKRPIVLPTLPKLYLPDVPNINIKPLPLLPSFEIPELPDLPSLPKVELPNLPPPPKLPKIFASIEGVVNILKLVAKALCILKKSPFVPEWRAGDQIAFLTERNGYLPTDFIDITLPQYSYPFIDAIKVTTWVNFEYDTEFLTEMARAIVKPINDFTNNIVNLFAINPDSFDFSDKTPSDINVGVDGISYKKTFVKLSYIISRGILKLENNLKENKDKTISNKEFIKLVNNSLSKKDFSNHKYDELRKTWQTLAKNNYSKQDEIIKKLQKNNILKFETLKNIIENEKQKTIKLKKQIIDIQKQKFEKISKEKNKDFVAYNKMLAKYNNNFIASLKNLINDKNTQNKEIKEVGKDLLTQVKLGLNNFKEGLNNTKKKILALNNNKNTSNNTNSCHTGVNKAVKYKYKGIYVVQDGYSYKLFDYIDNLTGKEEPTPIDFDNDKDKDLLYLVDGELFLKENLSKKESKDYYSGAPLKVDISDNKFFNQKFIEAVNNFEESLSANKTINLKFLSSTNPLINNYRIEFYNRVDKFFDYPNTTYYPKKLKKSIIDAISDIQNIGLKEKNDNYEIHTNIAYFDYIGDIPGVVLKTKKLEDIKETLLKNKLVTLTANTKLYSAGNSVKIYYLTNDSKKKEVLIDAHSNISFNENIKIYKITGDLYVAKDSFVNIKGQEIRKYLGKPILAGTKVTVLDDSKLNTSSHIDIKYYDGSSFGIDLRKLNFYRMYDLGIKKDIYLVSEKIKNDYYYAKIYAFYKGIIGTKSNQILLSPQLQADNLAPELDYDGIIRIPVYKEKIIDFTNYIFDNSGIDNIKEIKVNKLNPPKYEVLRSPSRIKIKFGSFDRLFKTNIEIELKDENGNITKKEIPFEVYSPRPEILNYKSGRINGYIDEKIDKEPINIYRIRGNSLAKVISDYNKSRVYTDSLGNFVFPRSSNLEDSKLFVKENNLKIFDINGDSGKINIGSSYTTKVKIENDYPVIYVLKSNKEIYKQKMVLKNDTNLDITSDFNNLIDNGIYLKLDNSKYSYYKNPSSIAYDPGVIAIYRNSDTSKTPLFVIFRDGRIKILNSYYKLEYFTYKDNIGFKLIDKHYNKIIGEVLYKLKANFVIN